MASNYRANAWGHRIFINDPVAARLSYRSHTSHWSYVTYGTDGTHQMPAYEGNARLYA